VITGNAKFIYCGMLKWLTREGLDTTCSSTVLKDLFETRVKGTSWRPENNVGGGGGKEQCNTTLKLAEKIHPGRRTCQYTDGRSNHRLESVDRCTVCRCTV
jgi:hypothetical protein